MRPIAIIILSMFIVACSKPESTSLTGYVEADMLYLAPQDSGIVKALSVSEGDKVKAGDVLFTLDPARATFAAEQASATALGVAARASDDGAMEQQIVEAEAALALSEKTFQRSKALVKDGAVSKEKYDIDASAVAAAKARLERAKAERSAMLRDWESAAAAAQLAERRLADIETSAPAAGTIERIYRRPGEFAAMGDPVVALLPPENLKLKFFAPERLLSAIRIGAEISFSCDGCAAAQSATVSFVASEPQFTPPVIYSIKEREKLVFLIEARPDDPAGLRPGLPVTIALP